MSNFKTAERVIEMEKRLNFLEAQMNDRILQDFIAGELKEIEHYLQLHRYREIHETANSIMSKINRYYERKEKRIE